MPPLFGQTGLENEADAAIPLPDDCPHPLSEVTLLVGATDRSAGDPRSVAWCSPCKAIVEPALGHVFHVDPADVRMGFEAALVLLKQGAAMRRSGWMTYYRLDGELFRVFYLATGQPSGMIGHGIPTGEILATDWELVP